MIGPTSGLVTEDAVSKILGWIESVRSVNKDGSGTTRIAEDDATWWIRNGYTSALASLERSLYRDLPPNTSILCAFDISKLAPKDMSKFKTMIECHDYVIIEEPSFAVYKFGNTTFRNEGI